MRYFCAKIAAILLFGAIPIVSYSQTNENVPAISEETANRAKEYFDVLSQITMSLNGTKCDQIQRDIRSVNTPQNRMKMDFDLSSLPGAISQKIANQYQPNIQAYREANSNYLAVCKGNPLVTDANADLHELFKLSVAKADANYEKMKVEADKAAAEAMRAKAEAEKAKAEADKAKAEADSRRAQADKAKAEADKARAEASNAESVPSNKPAQSIGVGSTCSTGEECHVSNWRATDTNEILTIELSNVCWQNKPIRLSSFECGVLSESINSLQTDITLGDTRRINARKTSMSRTVLSCAKASNNDKLAEVAQKCNGKWY